MTNYGRPIKKLHEWQKFHLKQSGKNMFKGEKNRTEPFQCNYYFFREQKLYEDYLIQLI